MSTGFATPARTVDRPALRNQLDQSLQQPLTFLIAAAGSGKSVLLQQWASTHPERAFVWLEVVTADNDPVRFSRKILRGLSAVRAEFADLLELVSMHGGGLGTPLLEALSAQMAELPRPSSSSTTSTAFLMSPSSMTWVGSLTCSRPGSTSSWPAGPIRPSVGSDIARTVI